MADRSGPSHEPLGRSIARIRDEFGQVVGGGFLIAPDRVATCAHVVTAALGGDPESERPPEGTVVLDFPLADPGGQLVRTSARVSKWVPVRADRTGDIALLTLADPVWPPARVPPMRRVPQPWTHEFRVLGFPEGMSDGVWASGQLLGQQGTQWIQLRGAPNGQPVVEGFSGTPVWDADAKAVVGMTVAADGHRDVSTAYLIPIEQVLGVDPDQLPNPYRGLEPFDERHAEFFYGRDEDIARLEDSLRRHPILVVLGQSGVGKSSLVRAGLLPRLRKAGAAIVELRPLPTIPARFSLAFALARLLRPDADAQQQRRIAADLESRLSGDPATTRWLAGALAVAPGAPLPVLFLDQFEELAAENPAAAKELLHRLIALIRAGDSPPLRLVLTLRWEAVSALMTEDTAEALDAGIVSLAPMGRNQLRAAITGPTERAPGLYFENGLVEQILDDAGAEPGQLPLVESLLAQLWEQRDGGYVTTAAYEWLGGVSGAITMGAERALAGFVGPGEPELLRRLCTLLARPSGDGFARRAVPIAQLAPGVERLARRLAQHRLVVIGPGADGTVVVELAHQALIDNWPRLRHWLDKDLDFLRWREQLDQHVTRWNGAKRSRHLLLRGRPLRDALRWLAERPAEHLPDQLRYLHAGRQHRIWRRVGVSATAAVIVAAVATAATLVITRPHAEEQPIAQTQSAVPPPVTTSTTSSSPPPPPTSASSSTPPSTSPTSAPSKPAPPPQPPPTVAPKPVDVPLPTNCGQDRICFYPEPNYQGYPQQYPVERAMKCTDVPFVARSVYKNSTQTQFVYSNRGCGSGVPVTLDAAHPGFPDIQAVAYRHS
ncbi:trypsin-like peptidase domain-containing protein [Kibdelosporangium phytohabitans]|uniref:HTH cro/C1-type domain-containing protein n=1 Tax=Kibdelosporangium phytohabitans TaxID=860235 RepID=A0A0N9I1N2_9PSEU|nr:AAA family ATPase [Kibdelosporangium phytohabitans]ALG08340.1 hypothetical protein AOZ06_16750 [Kibdelosporangium phytohabitans]MBE1470627.1 hypothetical protein [Kibdelosporangium phytohabitans]